MGDRQAGQAVGNKNHVSTRLVHRRLNGFNPIAAFRLVPIALLNAPESWVCLFPEGLPVLWPRVADPGKNQYTWPGTVVWHVLMIHASSV